MAERIIKKRSEGETEYQWDTSAVFASDEAWKKAFDRTAEYASELKKYEGSLAESGKTLFDFLEFETETVNVEAQMIFGYASLKADEDTAVSAYQDMKGKAVGMLVSLSTAAAFEIPEIVAIDEEKLNDFYKDCPALEKYRIAIDDIRRRKEHFLSPLEEQLLAAAGEIAESPNRIYDLLEGADMQYADAVGSGGDRHQLTAGSLVPLLGSPDRELRISAFNNFYDVWESKKNVAAALLDAQGKQLRFFSSARRYNSSLEAALDGNNVPVSVYDNLIEAVNKNLPKLHKYMALRKKLMELDELHMYDIYRPMVSEAEAEIPFEEAKEAVLKACSVLGEKYVSVLKKAFNERWLDVYENIGKRSGAYSSDVARPHPFVLLNYKDTLDSEFTLAHEMGHTMHSYLSNEHQPPVYSDYVIFVAEVASTVNEALLMQYLLKNTEDKTRRAYLINYFLEQFRTTLYRQTMFAEFEKTMGEMIGRGDTITADELCKEYYELNKRYYGEAVEVDSKIAMEWARIPHFYYNYYVFQYATGFSAAMAISKRILSGGEEAVADYLRFLSGGCSKPPIELLKIAGADMTTAKPVCDALELFDSLIDQLDELMK